MTVFHPGGRIEIPENFFAAIVMNDYHTKRYLEEGAEKFADTEKAKAVVLASRWQLLVEEFRPFLQACLRAECEEHTFELN